MLIYKSYLFSSLWIDQVWLEQKDQHIGLVGVDGPTHCGAFDITYMVYMPNMVVMAPSYEAKLINMVATTA